MLIFYLLGGFAAADYCINDPDCNSTAYCDIPNAVCTDKLAVSSPCTRDALCLSGWCNTSVCNTSTFTYNEYVNDPTTTDFSDVADTAAITNPVIANQYGSITWDDTLNLSQGMNFDTACEFGNEWIYCDGAYAPQLDTNANLTILDTPYTVYVLDSIIVLRDGMQCENCTDQSRSGDDISFSVIEFSNYSLTLSSNYSAVIENFTCPAELYLPSPTGRWESCIYFTLRNTNGELLENQDADIYITDTSTGVVVKKFKTLATDGEFYEDQNGNFISISDEEHPLTNARGQYSFCFETDNVWANYNDNLTIHAVANGQKDSCTVSVDVGRRADIEGWEVYLRKYSGLLIWAFIIILAVTFLAGYILNRLLRGWYHRR